MLLATASAMIHAAYTCMRCASLIAFTVSTAYVALCRLPTQGSAVIVEGGAGIVAVDCKFESELLGMVVKESDEGCPLMTVSLTGCSFSDCMWGAFLGCDLSAETEQQLLGVNTFQRNSSSNITRQYHEKQQNVQPWRRSWALAAAASDTTVDTTADTAADTAATVP
jgi:hypothetical protein